MLLHELRAVFVDGAAERARLRPRRRTRCRAGPATARRSRSRSCPSPRATSAATISARPSCAWSAPRDAPAAGNDDARRSGSWRPAPSRPVRRWSRRQRRGPARQARRQGNCAGRAARRCVPANRLAADATGEELALRRSAHPGLGHAILPMRLLARARSSVRLAWRIPILVRRPRPKQLHGIAAGDAAGLILGQLPEPGAIGLEDRVVAEPAFVDPGV